MTTAFPQRPISRQSRQKKAPGETELIALFQLISQPALLVDSFQEQVIQVNSPLLQLTAFSSTEIVGCSLRDILQGLPEHPLSMDDHSGILLARRNRTLLPVNVHVHILDTSGQWMVIFLEPQDESRGNLMNRIEQVIQTLTDMNCCAEEAPVDKVLERTVGLIQALLEVDVVAIYRVDSGTGGIWKAVEVGDTGWLPDTISPNELIRLSTSTLWRPGKRMQTELHRSGRIENLTFLASAPIEQSGLLVIADHCQEPPENLEMVLEALARQAGAVLMHQLQLAEMRRLALENHRDLNIWHSVAENAQEGILLLSPDLTVNEMNPAAEWMLGYTDWEVKGELVENILIGPERLSPALEMACQGIPTHNMGNISLHRRNGQSFPAHMEIIPAQRESETLAILIFFSDVSEHLEIRNRTQQLEQRAVLGEVTAVFAHEVRNPINNISTGLQLLSVKLPENDPSQENINRLLVDCQRLNHLMESVLGFSRFAEHQFEAIDLDQLLHRLLDRWRPRMAKVNVTSFYHFDEKTPPVLGDPRSLDQVFTNLISNAVEAMGSTGGTLSVRVAPIEAGQGRPQVEVTVSDSGPGIPDEIKEHIFDPFVTTKSQGTGLGLAITKRIVTAHHGSITVNTFPGGTVFHVLLSAYQGDSE